MIYRRTKVEQSHLISQALKHAKIQHMCRQSLTWIQAVDKTGETVIVKLPRTLSPDSIRNRIDELAKELKA